MYKNYTKKLCAPLRHIPNALLIMKITIFILTAAIMQVSAAAFAQKITLNQKKAPLKNIITSLRKQSGYDFLYTQELLQSAKPVDINVKGAELKEVLEQVFKDQPLTYTIEDRTVVISEKIQSERVKQRHSTAPDQNNELNGAVINIHNEPLFGATIIKKHEKTGTTTDVRGIFSLKDVDVGDTVIVSFIGYKTQVIPITKPLFLNIRLEEATSALDEVVVQAYGQTTQRLTTSSIGRVTAADIEKQTIMNPLLAIEGRIPGVVVTPGGYEEGSIKIEIRGRGSIDPNFTSDPLYIIDGVPMTIPDTKGTTNSIVTSSNNISRGTDQTGLSLSQGQSPLYSINPADIQSIEVLKDADATAIYGSRGANGVILITTKKGRAGATQFDLNGSQGINMVTTKWNLLNTQQYLSMRNEAYRNDGITPIAQTAPDLLLWDRNSYTDWQKYSFGQVAKKTTIQAAVSGGNDQTVFRIATGYNRSTDINTLSGADQRATVAFNLTSHSPSKRFVVSLSANYGYTDVNQSSSGRYLTLPPNAPGPYNSQGVLNFSAYSSGSFQFPFAGLLKPYNSKQNSLTADLSLTYNIAKGLIFRTSLGYNSIQNTQYSAQPIASEDPYQTSSPIANANFGNTKINNVIIEPQLDYTYNIGQGTLKFLAGATYQNNSTNGQLITANGYTSDIFIRSLALAPAGLLAATDNSAQYKYTGVFARINYNWKDRYILNINGRRDGSSRFGPGNQFGNFGSVGAAWIASGEKWLRNALPEAISFIKLRGSYGITGSDNVGDYKFLSQYGNLSPILTPYNGITPLTPQLEPNVDFHWQVNKKFESALDISLINDRINIEAAFYRNRCDNQLVDYPIPSLTGFTSVIANSPASVQNSGWEFSANATLIKNKAFSWVASFDIGFNRNKLLAYPHLDESPYASKYQVGQSLDIVYAYNFTGIDPLTGQNTYTDHNGDGKITTVLTVLPGTQNDDRYVIINIAPKYSGGFSHQFTYKNFSLSTYFSFKKQMGQTAFTGNAGSLFGGAANISTYQYDHRWQYPGQNDALFARLTNTAVASDNIYGTSTGVWKDASYIRLQSVSLSYALPSKMLDQIGIRRLAVNLNAQNLFVLTGYQGLDPETQNYSSQPPVKSVVCGLTASF
ncbi:SusC/RagA family TonB-linked outer membrane protein [Mucilaginibacter aquaedulcis]|uniref:SusC/RagA family TonB-linked outer membrane protein n=1 Tax=Mucilaginibacter aquaedulcis TaxID=1187081 RepID=UPI0025B61913|nr:SusC/RagA family TonB-linked outer membrane protein [Mucilaginibacter aquaedulcis]MDN3548831.1 SusC/RagA family TonB-linked outer membrane protein [Mucilaginibacter aquaedulcis]